MILLAVLLISAIICLVFSPVASGVWNRALLLFAAAFAVLAFCQFIDQSWERYNYHIKKWHLARIDPYRQFADSIRHLSPGTIDWMNRLMVIVMRMRVGMTVQNEIFVTRTCLLPSGDEEDVRFILDYLAASRWYGLHVMPGALWPELHHTRKLIAPVAEYLGDWSNLEVRIKNLQDAFVYWQLAFHRQGDPCRLMEGMTYERIAETLQLGRLNDV